MTGKTLYRHGIVNDLLRLRIAVIKLPELSRLLHCFCQGHSQLGRDKLRNPVHISVGKIKRSANIPDCAAGKHRTEGNNLGYMIFAVSLFYIIDDFSPANITEVHVNIRHGHSLRIQEALKKQRIAERVYVGNSKRICND